MAWIWVEVCGLDISVLSLLEKWLLENWIPYWTADVVRCGTASSVIPSLTWYLKHCQLKQFTRPVESIIQKAKVSSNLEGFCPFRIGRNLQCLSGCAFRFSHAVLVCLRCVTYLPSTTGQRWLLCAFGAVAGSIFFFSSGFLGLCCPQPTAFCGSRPVEKHWLGPALHIDIVD